MKTLNTMIIIVSGTFAFGLIGIGMFAAMLAGG